VIILNFFGAEKLNNINSKVKSRINYLYISLKSKGQEYDWSNNSGSWLDFWIIFDPVDSSTGFFNGCWKVGEKGWD
jgi:hypothetical protein